MEKTVYCNGKSMGKACLYSDNGTPMLEFSCPFEEGRVYKLFAQTKDKSVPLGVMLKNGGRFEYRRSVKGKKLGESGENTDYFYIERGFVGKGVTEPLMFSAHEFRKIDINIETDDMALKNCLEDEDTRYHIHDGTTYLCAALKRDKPFALAPFFCLVTVVYFEGEELGVIMLSGQNNPDYLNKQA